MNDTESVSIKVAEKINEYKLVINRGSTSDIKMNQRFLVYTYGKEVTDPDTGQSLGKLEIVRGTGRVLHLQELQATIESDMERHVRRLRRYPDAFSLFSKGLGGEEVTYETEKIPFESPEVGDMVKPV